MSKKTVVYNATGKLKRVLLGKPDHFQYMPLSDPSRDLTDAGKKPVLDAMIQQHKEFEDVFRQLGVEISWVKLDPTLLWQSATRDFGVNTPAGALIGRFRYRERKGEEVRGKETLEELGETILSKQIMRGCMEGGDCYWLNNEILVIG